MNLRDRKKLETRRAIRAAALRLFDEQGYGTTTIEHIASEANVSRATFFNYFSNKDAVVLDEDPEARQHWQALMDERPPEEPLWTSLTLILRQFNASLRDVMTLQRRLQVYPVVESARNLGVSFRADLGAWVRGRAGADDLDAQLQLSIALAASTTAYRTWPADASFDDYLARVEYCLDYAGRSKGCRA